MKDGSPICSFSNYLAPPCYKKSEKLIGTMVTIKRRSGHVQLAKIVNLNFENQNVIVQFIAEDNKIYDKEIALDTLMEMNSDLFTFAQNDAKGNNKALYASALPEVHDKFCVNMLPPNCLSNNIINELLQTEIAYIRSLQYIIENYLPVMQRTDLPAVLRGQQRFIFENIERTQEFHMADFLPDLNQVCLNLSKLLGLHIANCFLRHREKF